MHETTGKDDATRLRDFLRDRDVPCPLCRYNLRDGTGPQCPECRHELVLTLGVTNPKFLWFLLAVAPCMFSAIAAALLLIPMILQPLGGGGTADAPVFALDALGWLSALGGVALIHYRFAFLRQKPGRQRACAAAVWALHGLAALAFFVTMLVVTGGP